jgi:hypothetical protein
MKFKKLLNLSEATVELDTVDFDNLLFQEYLKRNDIKTKVVKEKGPAGGWPVIEYTGAKRAVEMMIHRFFGDDDLKDLIQERMDAEEKVIRTYKKGKDAAVVKKQEDNSILIAYTLNGNRSGAGLKTEFRNANDATRWLESNGWELDELHEGTQMKKVRVYLNPKRKLEAEIRTDKDGKVFVVGAYETSGEDKQFSNINLATAWLEQRGYELRDLHEAFKPAEKGDAKLTKITVDVPSAFGADWRKELKSMANVKKLAELFTDEQSMLTIEGYPEVVGNKVEFPVYSEAKPDKKEVDKFIKAFVKWCNEGALVEEKMPAAEREQVEEDIEELKELQEQMIDALEQAEQLLRKYKKHGIYERAKSYWLAHAKMAVSNDHGYLGNSGVSLEDTLEELEEYRTDGVDEE